jgi:NAD(P)-dependent dehydrogenase (short-subunit alcohol dehydrogenase family)
MTQKTWFITGAPRGIGSEIAKAVLAAGGQLIATARNKTDLYQFESNQNVLALSLDIRPPMKIPLRRAMKSEELIPKTP